MLIFESEMCLKKYMYFWEFYVSVRKFVNNLVLIKYYQALAIEIKYFIHF